MCVCLVTMTPESAPLSVIFSYGRLATTLGGVSREQQELCEKYATEASGDVCHWPEFRVKGIPLTSPIPIHLKLQHAATLDWIETKDKIGG